MITNIHELIQIIQHVLTSHGNLGLVVGEIDLGQALWERSHLPDVRVCLVLQRVEGRLLRRRDLLGELGPIHGGRGHTASGHLAE